ncbi:hypothetical protein K3727_09495 [Rhodobacteraceae bacterium M382]|nr:hypothetical protein K3727_09495 [Rhodobacteraceae bacterium M382]
MIPTFTRSYEAAAAIAGHLIVAFADPANASTVTPATSSTDALIGTADSMGADLGGMCDVHRGGVSEVRLGGPVQAGDPITADANAKGIAATASAATTVRIIGYAEAPGVADDIIQYFAAPGLLHQG